MSRRPVILSVALIAILIAAPAPVIAASKSAAEFLEPVVTHRQFTALSQEVGLNYDQRVIAEMLFADYTEGIAVLGAEADRRADAVGRQRVLDAFAGRAIVDPAELRQLRLAVLGVYEQTWHDVDQLLDDLLSGVRSLLTDEQRGPLPPAMTRLRRTMLLHPRTQGNRSYEYAGDGVNVLDLLDEAMKPDGELAGLGASKVGEIRERYEQQLDALLVETAAEHRAARMAARRARIARDASATREAEEQLVELWRRHYDLNEHAVRRIGEIAAGELGEEAQRHWLGRFDEACFPWLFAGGMLERQRQWLDRQQLTAEQQEAIGRAYAEHAGRRRELQGEAISIMLRARRDMRTMIYPMMDASELESSLARGLYEQLLRNSGELAGAEAATTDRIDAALTDHQRAALRRAVRRR